MQKKAANGVLLIFLAVLLASHAYAASPDINIQRIDGYIDNNASYNLPVYFSYFNDGNLTITFTVKDVDRDDLNFNMWYSTSAGARENVLVHDLNLTTKQCDSNDWTSTRQCRFDWNANPWQVADANYFIDVVVNDGTTMDSNSSSTFKVTPCPRDTLTLAASRTLYGAVCSDSVGVADTGNDGVIKIGANNITLDCNGMKLAGGYSGYAISDNSYDGVTIKNCDANRYNYGIYLYAGAGGNIIRDNNMRSMNYGILLTGASVTDNNIYHNNLDMNNVFGIRFNTDTNRNSLSDNNISDNNLNGVLINASGDINIFRNEIRRNGRAGTADAGIYISSGGDVNITDNNIQHNRNYGIYLIGSRNFVKDNNLMSNGTNIYMVNTKTNKIISNEIRRGGYGILLSNSGSNDNNIYQNNIDMNNVFGIYIQSDANRNSISDNNISDNNSISIYIATSGDINIFRNELSYNGRGGGVDSGIYVASGGDVNIADNNTVGNNKYGLYLSGGRHTIKDNNILANKTTGIYLTDITAARLKIIDNNISGNTFDGIYLEKSAKDMNIYDNNISANGRYGIYSNGAFDLNIYHNDINYNGNTGFYSATGNVDINLTKNIIRNNTTQDIYLNDTNILFLDGNYGSIAFADINAKITRAWYVDVNVGIDPNNTPANGASIDINDTYNTAITSTLTTAADGTIATLAITQFDQNSVSATPYYYTPHTVGASMSGYDTNNYQVTIDSNKSFTIFIRSSNANPDINITHIDGWADNNAIALKVFSYGLDGNLTITFTVIDTDQDDLNFNMWYSSAQGARQNKIVSDLNLFAAKYCDSNNWVNTVQCRYDWNTGGVADGNYFIDVALRDSGGAVDYNSSSSIGLSTYVPNNIPDINITHIDGWADNNAIALKVFSYGLDGNLTITFTVIDKDRDDLNFNMWYSTSAGARTSGIGASPL